jgi:tetratricopeptide (TPR) repeat protein
MSLVGRTSELASIDRWLAGGGRLLTVLGPPGVGKSRIAREVVAQRPGTVLVDMTACRTSADVERAMQRALGVSKARLARALAMSDGLVVLDRFDHLVEAARGLIDVWTLAPGARFVLASREALGLPSEVLLPLGPLEASDAVALYAERARRPIDARVAAAIVSKLNRLPLSIELSASLASALSDAEILARLEAGIGSIDTKAKRLSATIRWSIDLLSPAERATLLRCATFRGPFEGRTAEAVTGLADTIASLVALERKSLLFRSEGRLALYDAVRDVALEQLEVSGGLEDARGRHAAHYAALAQAAVDQRDPLAARALATESGDVAYALAYLQDKAPLAFAKVAVASVGQPPSSGAIERLSTAITLAEQANDPVLAARALVARAQALRLLGGTRTATRDLRAAVALARAAHDSVVEADSLRLLGVVARQLVRPLRARTILTRALALYEAAGVLAGTGVVLDDLGVVAHDLGELATARDSYERALAAQRIVGDRRFEGITLGHLGLIAHDFGDLDGALAKHREALDLHTRGEDRRFEGFAHAFIATILLEQGDVDEARNEIARASAIDARLGDIDSGALLAGIACAVAAASGKIAEAKEILARALLDVASRDDDGLRRMLGVFALTIDIAEARRAAAEGRSDDDRAHRKRVRDHLATHAPRNIEDRLARRVVERLFGSASTTIVAADGTWFDAGGARVALGRRKSLIAMLARLASARVTTPGQSVSLEALFDAGWPGERIPEASARRRVYVGIDSLRALRLGPALLQKDRGYLLDPAVQILNEL